MSSLNSRMYNIHALLHIHLRIFDNQNSVLCCQTNQGNQTDLHINVILQTTCILYQEAAENCGRYRQQYCQRNCPAFIQSCQTKEYENQRDNENLSGTAAGFNLIKALTGPFVGIGIRQNLLSNLFNSSHSLTGGITAGRVTGNHNRTGTVKACHNNRAVLRSRLYKCIQRNRLAVIAAYKEVTHILYTGTIFFISLHNNLPSTAEVIDIVDFVTA